jgi:hypothetical protein
MRSGNLLFFGGLACVLTSVGSISAEREMTVRQAPDSVFDVPVAELLPQLTGARETGVNGRVGNEFVFWGYRLDIGEQAWLYACAIVDDVDCEQRRAKVCDTGVEILAERTYTGSAVRRRCLEIGLTAPGDLHPGCRDLDFVAPLAIGVLTCT